MMQSAWKLIYISIALAVADVFIPQTTILWLFYISMFTVGIYKIYKE